MNQQASSPTRRVGVADFRTVISRWRTVGQARCQATRYFSVATRKRRVAHAPARTVPHAQGDWTAGPKPREPFQSPWSG
jgi:hypothetical protein